MAIRPTDIQGSIWQASQTAPLVQRAEDAARTAQQAAQASFAAQVQEREERVNETGEALGVRVDAGAERLTGLVHALFALLDLRCEAGLRRLLRGARGVLGALHQRRGLRSLPDRSLDVGGANRHATVQVRGRERPRGSSGASLPRARRVAGGRRWGVSSGVLLLHRRVALTISEIGFQRAQFSPQVDYGLRVDLRDPRLRDVQRSLDLLERQAFEVVERDDRPLLRRQVVDRADERGLDLPRLDGAGDLRAVVAQRVEQRDLVAALVRQKLLERENRRAANLLHQHVELFEGEPHLVGDFVFGRRTAELDLQLLVDALQLARALADGSRYPVERSERVENRAVDQIVDLDVRGQVDRNSPGHVLH